MEPQTLLFKKMAQQLFSNPKLKTITLNPKHNDITSSTDNIKKKNIEDLKMTAAGNLKDEILSLDLPPHKVVDPGKYKSEAILEPKNEADRQKYFLIYTEFVSQSLTQKQLAEKHGYSVTHMSRIIKWSACQIGRLDNDSELQTMIDFNKIRLQEIRDVKNILKEQLKNLGEKPADTNGATDVSKVRSNIVGDIAKCWKAEMQVSRLISQITGLLSGAVIQIDDHRSVNYQLAPSFERKTGSGMLPGDDIKRISPGAGGDTMPAVGKNDITHAADCDINSAPITNIERGAKSQ